MIKFTDQWSCFIKGEISYETGLWCFLETFFPTDVQTSPDFVSKFISVLSKYQDW